MLVGIIQGPSFSSDVKVENISYLQILDLFPSVFFCLLLFSFLFVC